MSGSESDGRHLMQSALDQWMVVEQMQEVAKRFLPRDEQKRVEAATSSSAVRARRVLKKTARRRTPTGKPSDDATEKELRIVLNRLEVLEEDSQAAK